MWCQAFLLIELAVLPLTKPLQSDIRFGNKVPALETGSGTSGTKVTRLTEAVFSGEINVLLGLG